MAKARGADFRVQLAGIFYAVQRVEVSARVADILVTNSEGQAGNPAAAAVLGSVARIADIQDGSVRLVSATWDDEHNPWDANFNLDLGTYNLLVMFPSGVLGPAYDWGFCLLTEWQHSSSIPGPQPTTLTLMVDALDIITPRLP
jgi:hypothetical protein